MNQVLVTGGLDFIGSHTSVELWHRGYDVLIADNLSNSSIDTLNGISEITGKTPRFKKVDFTNQADTKELFQSHPIQPIIHFATSKAVGESVANPLLYYRDNLVSLKPI